MAKIGTQLAALAYTKHGTHAAYVLERMQRASGREPSLSAENIVRVFEGGGTFSAAIAIAARMGRKIVVRGWCWRNKDALRIREMAEAAGLSEKAAMSAIIALNSLANAPDGIRIETLEKMLATCPGAGLVLEGGLNHG